MDLPVFSQNQFVDQSLLNGAATKLQGGIQQLGAAVFAPGIFFPDVASVSASGLIAELALDAPFQVLFSDGTLAGAHGTITGQDTQSYSVDFTGLVPVSGSVTAYLLLSQSSVSEDPVSIIGPPPGHPDFNPGFAPSTAYTTSRDTLTAAASITAPDNESIFELFRCTLVAGATGLGTLNYEFQRRASAYAASAIQQFTSSQTLTPQQLGGTVVAAASGNFTLPLAEKSNGLSVEFVSQTSGNVVIQSTGTDFIYGLTENPAIGVGSMSLPEGTSVKLRAVLGQWAVIGGSAPGIGGYVTVTGSITDGHAAIFSGTTSIEDGGELGDLAFQNHASIGLPLVLAASGATLTVEGVAIQGLSINAPNGGINAETFINSGTSMSAGTTFSCGSNLDVGGSANINGNCTAANVLTNGSANSGFAATAPTPVLELINSNIGDTWVLQHNNNGDLTFSFDSVGVAFIDQGGTYHTTSDVRLKEEIERLDVRGHVNPVTYVFKSDKYKKRRIGVIAQELVDTHPELVSKNDQGNLSVDYGGLAVVAIDRVQRAEDKLADLEARLARLERLIGEKR